MYNELLDFVFPNFKKTKESRFSKLFNESKSKCNNQNKKLDLNGHKIFTGEDKRTTIFIKNIPKNMTKNQLKMLIEKIANINYIYIPLFMLTADNLRCAYVNVVNSKSIIDIYLKMTKMKFDYDNPNTRIEISYSKLQGRKALIDYFQQERNIFKNNNSKMNNYVYF